MMTTRTLASRIRWSIALLPFVLVPCVARAQSGVVEYYHLDAVGSVRAVTAEDGSLLRLHDFKPFGEEITTPSTADRKLFTGQERDHQTGLDYVGARYYRPDLGRFTSADDASFLDPYQSGSGNLYAHAFGNPLRWVDPTGHNPQCLYGTDYCVDVSAPMPPDAALDDPGLARFIWEGLLRSWEMAASAAAAAQEAVQTAASWAAAPRDPACMGTLMMGGAAAGAAWGGGVGVITGPGEVAVVPVGMVTGAVGGGVVGLGACMSGSGGGGGGGARGRTPATDPGEFEPVRGTPGKRNKTTGEIWVKDPLHKDHYEVYKNKRDFESGRRARSVWADGRAKGQF